jgi:arsenate reductase
MRKKIYHLGTCNTNQRIIKELGGLNDFEKQDIKKEAITEVQLEEMKNMAGSYEALFSRRSRQYSALGLKDKSLTDADFKKYILQDYTFLKRPVLIIGNDIFVGNARATVDSIKDSLQK